MPPQHNPNGRPLRSGRKINPPKHRFLNLPPEKSYWRRWPAHVDDNNVQVARYFGEWRYTSAIWGM